MSNPVQYVCLLLLCVLSLAAHAQAEWEHKVSDVLNEGGENPVYSMLFYVADDSGVVLDQAFGVRNKEGARATKQDTYRIASATKMFVSTVILQLVMERKLALHDKLSKHLKLDYIHLDRLHMFNGQSYGESLTIEQLLSHRSGLADVFTDKGDEFFDILMKEPQHRYSPEEIVGLYYRFNLDASAHFRPGEGWNYSDMNYVLLGLLIEVLDKQPLAASIRSRILDPLGMSHTFFEHYEDPDRHPVVHQYFGSVDITEINTSFDWAGGGLVSNNQDLAVFMQALFGEQLIDRKMLNKMTDTKYTREGESRYGLGVYESVYNGETFYGHYGFWGSYIGYSPRSRKVLSYCISQATPNFNVYSLINDILVTTE